MVGIVIRSIRLDPTLPSADTVYVGRTKHNTNTGTTTMADRAKSTCDLSVAKLLEREHKNDCKTRRDIAKIIRSYRSLGYNGPTLYEASYRLQRATNNIK